MELKLLKDAHYQLINSAVTSTINLYNLVGQILLESLSKIKKARGSARAQIDLKMLFIAIAFLQFKILFLYARKKL